MLGAAAGLGEVGVSVFQDRVLIAMAELTGQAGVSVVMVLLLSVAPLARSGSLSEILVMDKLLWNESGYKAAAAELFAGASGGRNSEFAKALAGLQSFRRTRVALDYVAELLHSVFLFAEFDQRKTFFN